jgi:hypothetical protein
MGSPVSGRALSESKAITSGGFRLSAHGDLRRSFPQLPVSELEAAAIHGQLFIIISRKCARSVALLVSEQSGSCLR